MSELKVIKIELNNHGKPIASIQGTTSYCGISPNDAFYTKSEADKAIAELEETLKNSRNARKYWRKEYLIEYKECSYQKYKRCLAMASRCFSKSNYHFALFRHGEDVKENDRKSSLYLKWRWRWLAIADKFKEAK